MASIDFRTRRDTRQANTNSTLPANHTKALSLAALVSLSLLWAVEALLPDLLPQFAPSKSPNLAFEAIPFGLISLLAAMVAILRRTQWPSFNRLPPCVKIALGLFVVPAVLIRFADEGVSAYGRTALFTLVPVFSIVLEPYLSKSSDRPLRRGFAAALASAVGALFVFQIELPVNLRSSVAYGSMICAAASIAAAACQLYAISPMRLFAQPDKADSGSPFKASPPFAPVLALVAGTAGLGLYLGQILLSRQAGGHLFGAKPLGWREIVPACIFAIPEILLLLVLLTSMRPARSSTRYVLAPLATILLGLALLRLGGGAPAVQPRTWAGMAIMGAAAIYLLLTPEAMEETPGNLGLR